MLWHIEELFADFMDFLHKSSGYFASIHSVTLQKIKVITFFLPKKKKKKIEKSKLILIEGDTCLFIQIVLKTDIFERTNSLDETKFCQCYTVKQQTKF